MAATKVTKGTKAIPPERVRAFWAERQRLAGGSKGASAADVLAATGWARSVAGCNPYLALRDRAGLSRQAVDAAVATLEIHELPAARGCTYVVPKEDYAIALRASQGHTDEASIATAVKYLGVTRKEIDRLADRVLALVARTPLDPAAIREALGDAVRSLGAEGKKRGTSSTLPLALGTLQTRGLIRRVSTDGRLDQQRYRYVAWPDSPLAKTSLGDDELALALARRFFRWAGPAVVADFAWWAGLGAKAARAAVAELKLVPLGGEGGESERLLSAEDRDALLSMTVPSAPRPSFLASLDTLLHLHRDLAALLEPKDAALLFKGGSKAPVGSTLPELPHHPILDRGRVIGVWEWEGIDGKLVWRTFTKSAGVDPLVRKEGESLSTYIARELGDARSFSLDSPEKRRAAVDLLASVVW